MAIAAVFPQAKEVANEPLTRREREILAWLAENRSNREIADGLTIAQSSVKWYTRQIYAKLGINDRRQAATRARELGLISSATDTLPPLPALPAQLTPFVGHQTDLEQVSSLVTDPACRLITLTGTGGVGKTRLALKVAERLQTAYPQGTWLVELSPLDDPTYVNQTVAAAFGLIYDKGKPSLSRLQQYLQDKRLLLVLDNCEHVIEACAELVTTLLKTCPYLNILATSREALGITGEILYYVPSLTFPDPVHLPPVEQLLQYEAVRLFVDRAKVCLPGFVLSNENAKAVAQICKRLDGIPLALELAAVRVKVLDVEQIAGRLEERFQLLVGGSRTALPRHQTMRASLDWSYQFLTFAEKTLLQRLSVFSGGWALEAAEMICSDDAMPPGRVLDLLTQLINKSLVIVERTPEYEPRYYLQETVWEYAKEKLTIYAQAYQTRCRHCEWSLTISELADRSYHTPERQTWQKKLKAERDNLRAALAWSIDEFNNPLTGLKIANRLANIFSGSHQYQQEGCQWLKKGLVAAAKGHALDTILHSLTLLNLAALDASASLSEKFNMLDKAIELCQASDSRHRLVRASSLSMKGMLEAFSLGDPQSGLASLQASEAILLDLGEPGKEQLSVTLGHVSKVCELLQEDALAGSCIDKSLMPGNEKELIWDIGTLRLLEMRPMQSSDSL